MKLFCGLFLLLTAGAVFGAKPDGTKASVKPAATLPACSTMGGTNQLCGQISGVLGLVSGPDPLGLAGSTLSATTGNENTGFNGWTSGWPTTTGVPDNPGGSAGYTVPLTLTTNVSPLTLYCFTPGATITLNAATGGDSLVVDSCTIGLAGASLDSTLTATINFPATIPQALPLPFPAVTSGVSGTATYVCNDSNLPECTGFLGQPTTLSISNGSIGATCEHCTTMGLIPAIGTGLSFSMTQGGTVPAAQTVTVEDSPAASVSYAVVPSGVSGGVTWLSVSKTGGKIGGSDTAFQVSVNPGSLAPGIYHGSVTVYGAAANNSTGSLVEPVTFTISSLPTLNVTPTTLNFSSVSGSAPASQNVGVSTSSGSVSYAAVASSTGNWLSVSPTSGTATTTPANVGVSVAASGLAAGSYNGTVTFTCNPTSACSNPSGVKVNVTLTVTATLAASPTSESFSYTINGTLPSPATVNLTSNGGAITYTAAASSTGGWLTVTPTTSATTPGSASVSINSNANSLAPSGTPYTGTVTFTCSPASQCTNSGGTVTVSVSLTVSSLPTLNVTPTTLNYSSVSGSAPASQNVQVSTSTGSAAYAAVASSTGNWLSVSPTSGTATTTPANVGISASATGLAAGSYSGTVTFTCNPTTACSNPSGVTVHVTLTVTATLAASPTSEAFSYTVNGTLPSPATVSVTSNAASIAYTAAASTNWITVSPTSGTATTSGAAEMISINSNANSLAPSGTPYTGTVTFTCNPTTQCTNSGGTVTVSVSLTVSSLPTLAVTPTTLNYSSVSGSAPASQNVQVSTSSGSAAYAAVASSTGNWLSVSPTSGTATTTPANVGISASASGLAAGSYSGTVTFTCNPTTACSNPSGVTVHVTLTVTATLAAAPTSESFNYTINGTLPNPATVNLTSNGGAITYTASASSTGGWLSVSPTSAATTPGSASISINSNANSLTPGQQYTGTVTFACAPTTQCTNTSGATVSVTLTVAAPPTLGASPTSLNFSYQSSGTLPPSQQLTVSSNGAPINFTAAANGVSGGFTWLSVSPTSGTTSQALTVSVTPGSLAATTYNGTIVLTCNPTTSCANTGGTVTVNVSLVISSQPVFTGNPSSLSFSYTLGGTVPGSQPVSITSSSATSGVTAIPSVNWLNASLSGTSTPLTMTVSLVQANLPTTANTYNVSIAVAGTGASSLTYPVTLVVSPQPTLSVTPPSLTFNGTAGGANPAAQTLTVNGTGGTISFTAVASSTGGWLSVTPGSGSTNTTLQVSVVTTSLLANTYNGSIVVTATSPTGVAGSPVTIPVTLNLSANPLSASPTSLTFNYSLSGSAPAAQNLAISSTVAGVAFTAAASSAPWLSISPAGGTTPQTLSIGIITTGLTVGTYNTNIVATPTGVGSSPVTVPVTLNVTAAAQITASPTSLAFTYYVNGSTPASQPVLIAAGSTALSYTTSATSTGNWLAVSPASGTTPSSITVSLQNLSSLTPNTYNGSVTAMVSATDSVTIPVTLTVSAEPSITATPSTLSFNYTSGGTVPTAQSVAVATSNNAAATVTATPSASWLTAHLSAGTTPTSVLIGIAPGSMTAGTYNGTVTVSATGFNSATVNVSLVITQPSAVIQVSGNTAFTLANTAPPATSTLSISASDGSAQPFTISVANEQYNWVTISPTSGTSPASVTLTANPSGIPPGVYITPVTVTMSNLPIPTKIIPATLTVTGSNLTATPNMLTFNYQPAATFPPSQTIALTTSSGNTPISIMASSNVGWLTVTSSASATPATLTVAVNPGLLTVGTYYGSVQVKASGSPTVALSIPVMIVVNAAPQISVSPTMLSFAYQIGGAAVTAQSFAVASSSNNTPINYTVTAPSWLQVSPASGATPGSVLVTPNTAGLGPGTYSGNVSVLGLGVGTANVAVTLTVTGVPQLTVAPSTLTFAAPIGGATPAPQTITVSGGGAALSFTAAAGSTWLSVTPASGTTPATLAVSVNTAGLAPGLYTGTINLTQAGNPVPLMVIVTLGIGNTPTITGIINAASGATGEIAPGMAISIFGTSLGPATGTTFANPPAGDTIATTLAGTTVTFDGTAVPIIFTLVGQVNALSPFTFANPTTVIQVTYNGIPSASMTLPVQPTLPGLFTADASGKGQGAILNQDYSINSSTNPAAQGSAIMLYGTGGGTTNPASVLGAYNPIPPPLGALTTADVTATVGGQSATVDYSGPAPGLVSGIFQINVTLPANLPSGNVPLTVSVGGVMSQTVTVAVQ
ncbi:MAG: BACON domain-containing protein [Bryobacteraceae bacterium]